jgi:hypothetical protein
MGADFGIQTYDCGKLELKSCRHLTATSHAAVASRVIGGPLIEERTTRKRRPQFLVAKVWQGADIRWYYRPNP